VGTVARPLKSFVVLYLARGLGFGIATASLIIGGVALGLLVVSAISGKLADRCGKARVMQHPLVVYGVSLLVPFLVTSRLPIGIAVPFVALGGGVVMTLPYALLMPLMRAQEHGTLTGFYSLSRGVGVALGPMLAARRSRWGRMRSPPRTATRGPGASAPAPCSSACCRCARWRRSVRAL